ARAICARGPSRPLSRSCGNRNAGRNCTAWNSLCANALRKRPSAIPCSALSTANPNTAHNGPDTCRPRTAIATNVTIDVCASASTRRGLAAPADQREEGALDVGGAGALEQRRWGVEREQRAVAHQHHAIAASRLVHDVRRDEQRRAARGQRVEGAPQLEAEHRI